MYCNNCGSKIPDGAKFCNECGASIETPKKKNNDSVVVKPHKKEQQKPDPPKGNSASGCLTRLLGTILLLAVIVGIAYFLFYPKWRELYIYEKTTVTSDSPFVDTDSDYAEWSEDFCNSYLIKDNGYNVLSYEKDRSISDKDMKNALAGVASVSFSSNGSYARIEIKAVDFDETIMITYRSVNLKERIAFLRYFFLTMTNS